MASIATLSNKEQVLKGEDENGRKVLLIKLFIL